MKSVPNYFLILFFISLIIISFLISLHLPANDWETDFGHFYYISMYNFDSKNLYFDFFWHKGPMIILINDMISGLIGYGWKQSILIYFIFTLVAVYIFHTYVYFKYKSLIILFFSSVFFFTFFKSQGTHIYIDLVLISFLFLALVNYLKFIKKNSYKYFYLFISFIISAILVRIDTAIYLVPFAIVFFIFIFKEKNFKIINLKFLTICTFVIISIFLLLLYLNNFNFNDFYLSNINFNMEYSNSEGYVKFKNLPIIYHMSPNKLIVLILILKSFYYFNSHSLINKKLKVFLAIVSLLQSALFLFKFNNVYIFNSLYLVEISFLFFCFFKIKEFKNYELLMVILLNYTSIFIFLFSGSFKINHYLILLFGYCVHFVFFLSHIMLINKIPKYFFIILFTILSVDQSHKIYNSIKNPLVRNEKINLEYGLNNFFYNFNYIKNNKMLSVISELNTPVICDRGWLHIFNEKKSNGYMFDWWFYDTKFKSLNFEKISKFYNEIYQKKYSDFIIINKTCLENEIFSQSPYIKKILDKSFKINDLSFFNLKYELRQLNEKN